MDILDIQPFKGRNIYSHKPVIKAIIDIGQLYDTPTNRLGYFNYRLLQILPGLRKHCCSLGYEGGFVERLREGTYLAHVTEHMALELQSMMNYDVHYGKSRATAVPSVYHVIFEFRNEKFAVECLLVSVEIINMLTNGILPDIGRIVEHLARIAAESDLGISTGAIYAEARKRNIPVICLEHSSILQLGNGKHTRLMEASLTDKSACVAVDMAGNKHLTKQLLSEAGIPVPRGDVAYSARSALAVAASIGFPVVVKPFDLNQGKGVFTSITCARELEEAFLMAVRHSYAVVVERHIPGKDYRLLVVGDKMVAAAERNPPYVVGDGKSTIKELVDAENKNPLRGTGHEKPLTVIKIDDMSRQVLAKAGYDENSIPPKGEKVALRYNGNLSTGGTASNCTGRVHPHNARIAVKAAKLLKLDIAGIDITCSDISKPLDSQNGAVIEVNSAPGLRMHIHPTEGEPVDVAGDIMDFLYPPGKPTSVPIISVTGTNGKTTVTRMIAHTLALNGTVVGMTSTSGIYIGGECILKGDNTGALSAARVLRDTRVEAAVLETARGGIIKRGLGYDLADVGVIVNISDDHLGIDGIETLEEMARVKSLVVEAVKPDGTAVINADDKMSSWLLQRISCKKLLFSTDYENELIQNEIKAGNRTVCARDGSIYMSSENCDIFIAWIGEIPVTYNGRASCNVENSLAAISALLALGVPIVTIRAGIMSFKPDLASNPGRFNIFDMGDFSVLLDYAHNAAGYRAVAGMIRSFCASGFTGVIGMPGDRRNECIREVGRLCGRSFTKLYIKEDSDLRGRKAGEVADILYNAAVEEGMSPELISVIHSETKAFETAILEASPGEMVVLFYESLEPALDVIEKCRAILSRKDKNKEQEKSAPGLRESAAG